MDSDLRCPACGARTPLAKAAASSLEVRAVIDPTARGKLSALKTFRGIIMLLLGLALGIGAAAVFFNTPGDRTRASAVTAADLLRVDKPEALPEWISYSPNQVIDTGVQYVKLQSRAVTSKFVLLAVDNRWLLAKVNTRFEGGRVEGKLGEIDGAALSKIRSGFVFQAANLLPFQLDAERDLATSQRSSYILAAAGAVCCLLLCFSGVRNLLVRPRYIPAEAAAGSAAATGAGPMARPFGSATPASTVGASAAGALPLTPQSYWSSSATEPSPIPRTATDDFAPVGAPRRRSAIRLVILGILYAVAFFVAASIVVSVVSLMRAGEDAELGKRLAREAGEKFGLVLLFGSVCLASVLTFLGWLPGARRR
jgi:hypothetical protein